MLPAFFPKDWVARLSSDFIQDCPMHHKNRCTAKSSSQGQGIQRRHSLSFVCPNESSKVWVQVGLDE